MNLLKPIIEKQQQEASETSKITPNDQPNLTPEQVILAIAAKGYSIAGLVCGLAVIDKNHKIVVRTIDEFTSSELKYRSLYHQFNLFLQQNGK